MYIVLIQNPKNMSLEEFDLILETVYFLMGNNVY